MFGMTGLSMVDRTPIRNPHVEEPRPESVESDAGAWPESMDISFFADSAMTIPGMGDPGVNCGVWAPLEFCDTCGEPHFAPSKCEQRGCPDCWGAWSRRRTEKAVRRLTAGRWVEPKGVRRRVVHASISPPPGEVRSLSDVRRYRRKAQQIAKDKGVRGGVCVFHGYRVREEVKDTFRRLKEADAVDGGIWQYVRENGRGWRSQTYWSPHFHIVGLCEDFEADDPDEQDGWIARRHSSAAPLESLTDKDAYESKAKMLMYILSHATFEPDGMRSITWFGTMHATNFDPEAEVSEGALSVIERLSAEAVDVEPESDGEAEPDDCECEGCTGALRPMREASLALMDPEWCDEIGREKEHRLSVAFDWFIGGLDPPPGLKFPKTEADAREAFGEML